MVVTSKKKLERDFDELSPEGLSMRIKVLEQRLNMVDEYFSDVIFYKNNLAALNKDFINNSGILIWYIEHRYPDIYNEVSRSMYKWHGVHRDDRILQFGRALHIYLREKDMWWKVVDEMGITCYVDARTMAEMVAKKYVFTLNFIPPSMRDEMNFPRLGFLKDYLRIQRDIRIAYVEKIRAMYKENASKLEKEQEIKEAEEKIDKASAELVEMRDKMADSTISKEEANSYSFDFDEKKNNKEYLNKIGYNKDYVYKDTNYKNVK